MTSDAATVPTASPAVEAKQDASYPRTMAWYGVGVFSIVLMFLVLDRGVINLLVQPIKRDLHLSDTQMSLLLGAAPVIFYAFIGVPVSRLVDRTVRRALICFGVVTWSIMTALCGVSQNFWQLLLFRVGVGAGESFNAPATYSMMADMFDRERLPRAIAFLNVGFVAGGGISLIAGGAVIHLLSGVPDLHVPVIGLVHNWQLVFFMVGLPGIIAGSLLLTVREPKRRGLKGGAPPKIPLKTVVRYLLTHWRVYAPMFIGLGLSSIEAAGRATWGPAFYQRTFGWQPAQIGYTTGLISLACAPIGLVVGTWLAEHFLKKGQNDGHMRVVALAYTVGIPFSIAGPLMPNAWLALAMGAVAGIVGMVSAPSFNAAMQTITPNEMRGQVTALYLFVFSVIGSGIGPSLVAAVTDYALPSENLIKYAIAGTAAVMTPLSAAIIWWGVKAYGEAFKRSKEWY